MGILRTFCPGWPQTTILPNFISWASRIIGVSHRTQMVLVSCSLTILFCLLWIK
jgi:hypothetical protein